MTISKGWTAETMRLYLDDHKKDRRVIYRALRVLYDRQTQVEQSAQQTFCRNNVGFNGWDAQVLTDIAQRAERFGSLTEKQTKLVYDRICKYASQLADAANAKGSVPPLPKPAVQMPLFATAQATGGCPA